MQHEKSIFEPLQNLLESERRKCHMQISPKKKKFMEP